MNLSAIVITALAMTTMAMLLALVRRSEKNSIDDQTLAMATIGKLAVSVAHDMNNLLTVISGHAELLVSSEASKSAVDTITESCACAGRLTGQILSLAMPVPSAKEHLDATNHIGVMENILHVLGGSGMEIRYNLPSSPIFLRLSASQFDQVLINLVANSREAEATLVEVQMAERSRPMRSLGRVQKWMTLEVADNGQGMSSATRRRATDQFFTRNKDLGTGIGLNTVKRIVENANGKLAIRNRPQGGLSVQIDLPVESVEEA